MLLTVNVLNVSFKVVLLKSRSVPFDQASNSKKTLENARTFCHSETMKINSKGYLPREEPGELQHPLPPLCVRHSDSLPTINRDRNQGVIICQLHYKFHRDLFDSVHSSNLTCPPSRLHCHVRESLRSLLNFEEFILEKDR